jgi:Leu/Phe-tRNA-protein transferase
MDKVVVDKRGEQFLFPKQEMRTDSKWWFSNCGFILSWDGGIHIIRSLATLTKDPRWVLFVTAKYGDVILAYPKHRDNR